MLSNAYFLAKFRFDTAENEPAKNLQIFRKMHFSKNGQAMVDPSGPRDLPAGPRGRRALSALIGDSSSTGWAKWRVRSTRTDRSRRAVNELLLILHLTDLTKLCGMRSGTCEGGNLKCPTREHRIYQKADHFDEKTRTHYTENADMVR